MRALREASGETGISAVLPGECEQEVGTGVETHRQGILKAALRMRPVFAEPQGGPEV